MVGLLFSGWWEDARNWYVFIGLGGCRSRRKEKKVEVEEQIRRERKVKVRVEEEGEGRWDWEGYPTRTVFVLLPGKYFHFKEKKLANILKAEQNWQ
jgi:hypothetical protein